MAKSRAMREQGLAQIWEKGIFRMNFGRVTVCPQPTSYIMNKIQHLGVRIKSSDWRIQDLCFLGDLDIFLAFWGGKVLPKTCTIIYEHESGEKGMLGSLRAIVEEFAGFKEVELRSMKSANHPRELSDEQKLRLSRKYAFYGLGPWSVGVDGQCVFMRYQPVKAHLSMKTNSPDKTTISA